jgi:hypothetical protein
LASRITSDPSIVAYLCPHCQAPLEARSDQTYGWLRCPCCHRPGLPPEPGPVPRGRCDESTGRDDGNGGPDREALAGLGSSLRGGRVRRVAAASALFLSLLNALFSVLANDQASATLFGLIALACLALTVYPGRRRRRGE